MVSALYWVRPKKLEMSELDPLFPLFSECIVFVVRAYIIGFWLNLFVRLRLEEWEWKSCLVLFSSQTFFGCLFWDFFFWFYIETLSIEVLLVSRLPSWALQPYTLPTYFLWRNGAVGVSNQSRSETSGAPLLFRWMVYSCYLLEQIEFTLPQTYEPRVVIHSGPQCDHNLFRF